MPFLFFDYTYILVIIGMIASMVASAYVQRTYAKYDQVQSTRGFTGAEVARMILDNAGLDHVEIQAVRGDLTDHYSPNEKILRLSDATRDSRSVAAIGVAAHEVGHAIQDAENYAPMKIRGAIVPVVNLGSSASIPILFLGIIFGFNQTLINIGIILFSLTFLFQLITLPVEFDASRRAMAIINDQQILLGDEAQGASSVLKAAATTYIASAFASFLSLLRLVLLFGGRRD